MALSRHVLHDLAEEIRWTALLNSSWSELKAVATRALAEEQFHIHHGVSLARRLLSSPGGYMRLAPVLCELAPMGGSASEPHLRVGTVNLKCLTWV